MDLIPYKSYEEQLDSIADKNISLDFENEQRDIMRLKNHSYYSLINGYKSFFLENNRPDLMVDGTTFDQFYFLRTLEMDLGAILLKYLQVVEQGFRTRISHIIAREYTTDDQLFTLKANYCNTNHRIKIIRAMEKIRDNPNNNSYSYYFKKVKRVSIPPWILIQDLEFANVIYLYEMLEDSLRKEVRQEYISLDNSYAHENKQFSNSMHFIREYRNIFAHSKRNFKEKINFSLDERLSQQCFLCTLMNNKAYYTNKNSKSLYMCILLVISYLQDDFLRERFFEELYFMFLKDDYINENLEPITLFNGITIYSYFDLPETFFKDLQTSLNLKIV